jgi:hypothetical protein
MESASEAGGGLKSKSYRSRLRAANLLQIKARPERAA